MRIYIKCHKKADFSEKKTVIFLEYFTILYYNMDYGENIIKSGVFCNG